MSPDENPAEANYTLDGPRRLSQSVIWKIQRRFFERKGAAAWADGIVPSYITTNPYIANAYAQVALAFINDLVSSPGSEPLHPGQPVYILELGAGAGRLAFHWISKFHDSLANSPLKGLRYTYVLTDLPGKNLEFWQAHPGWKPWLDAGVVDFGRFDAENPAPLKLAHSGLVLEQGQLKNPLIVLANYFFDSIPQDAFYVEEERLYESRLEVRSGREEPDLDDPELLRRVALVYTRHPTTSDYYGDPDLNRILESYRRRLGKTSIDFPNAALGAIRFLRRLAGDRLLLLSGDKGYNREEALQGRQEPGYAVHGSFSMMVNYAAIAEYFRNAGGEVLATTYHYTGLNILAFLLGRPPGAYAWTRSAFHEEMEKRGPDDMFNLGQAVEPQLGTFSPEQLLAFIRFSGWDGRVFLKSFPFLLDHLGRAEEAFRRELHAAIPRIWENYYHVGEGEDLPFDLGMLLAKLGEPEEAIVYFDRSLELFGPAPSTYYNQGVCLYKLDRMDPALACADHALALNPEFEQAARLRLSIENWRASHPPLVPSDPLRSGTRRFTGDK